MPDGSGGFLHQIDELVKYLATALVAIFAWVTNRQVKRVDEIEKNYASTTELNETVKALRGDIQGIHKRLDNFIDRR